MQDKSDSLSRRITLERGGRTFEAVRTRSLTACDGCAGSAERLLCSQLPMCIDHDTSRPIVWREVPHA